MPSRERCEWNESAGAVQGKSRPRADTRAPEPVAGSWPYNNFSLSSELRLPVPFLRGNRAFQKYLCKSCMVMEAIQVSQYESVYQALLLSITCFAFYLIVPKKFLLIQHCQMPWCVWFFPFWFLSWKSELKPTYLLARFPFILNKRTRKRDIKTAERD